MRITFLLPGAGRVPVGGYKIVYEYANRLAETGHVITIVHAANLLKEADYHLRIRNLIRYLKRKLLRDYGPRQWFELRPDVNILWAPDLSSHHVPPGDVVIATAWQTAEWVADYPASHGDRFYFLQHKETWSGPEPRVMATWKLPLKKIVISRWLQQIAADLGEEAVYVPNGLDFQAFGMDVPPERRDPCT